jgi:excisionase family DNA binding protein
MRRRGTCGDPIPQSNNVSDGESRFANRRLLSPNEAATYLGLTSRFAIYRLVASGRLPAVRLANKIRLDLRDLDATIDQAKAEDARPRLSPANKRMRPRNVPRELAPLRHRRRSVTVSVTPASSRQ